ncbi:MAG: hypothetical protein HY770_08335 [Chitinivibrionia bacterium]|nr:hypothetical protein [Chitinivibrionia bacterium]
MFSSRPGLNRSLPPGGDVLRRRLRSFHGRVLGLFAFHLLIGGMTLLLAGIVLSGPLGGWGFAAAAGGGLLALFLGRRRFPGFGIETTARRVDERLALREGLVTALEFMESPSPMAPPLIRRMADRLIAVRPSQVFPFTFPRVLWGWPLLLLLIVLSGGRVGDFSFTGVPHPGSRELFSGEGRRAGVDPVEIRRGGERVGEGETPGVAALPLPDVRDGRRTEEGNSSPGEGRENLLLRKPGETAGKVDPRFGKPGAGGRGEEDFLEEASALKTRGIKGVPGGETGSSMTSGTAVKAGGKESVLGVGPTADSEKVGQGWIPGKDGKGGKGGIPEVRSSSRASLPVSLRRDLPEAYRIYVTRYFDAIQEGDRIDASR